MEVLDVQALGLKLLEFEAVMKDGKTYPFSMRAYTLRHFAEHEDGTAIIADTLGGFMHVTMRWDALFEKMAEYDRFIEVRSATVENGQVTIEKTQRCGYRASNIVWYGPHVEGGSVIVDCYAKHIRVGNEYAEIKRLLEAQ